MANLGQDGGSKECEVLNYLRPLIIDADGTMAGVFQSSDQSMISSLVFLKLRAKFSRLS